MKPSGRAWLVLVGVLIMGLSQIAGCSGQSPVNASGAELHQVDGGPNYYAEFSPSLPTKPSFFPIGLWLSVVTQPTAIASDQAAGVNTYVALSDNSNFNLVESSTMYLISNIPPTGGKRTVGWFVSDEVDMTGGPGSAPWAYDPSQGSECPDGWRQVPNAAPCGYTVQRKLLDALPKDRRFRYSNYGKGVVFWEDNAQAAQFVNDYQNVVSDDIYWFTDDSICLTAAQNGWYRKMLVDGTVPPQLCHLAANYGLTVQRIRSLARDRIPVWAYVELGHPFVEKNWPTITPQQVNAAVWQSLIAGARGIIYFNNSFGGSCVTYNVLGDPCYSSIRVAVTKVDSEIRSLAPVLNAPFADDVVTASPGVNISTKWYGGHFYILAGSNEPNAQVATFSMPCVGSSTVAVLNENRTIQANNGIFSDRFANGNAVHIYRIDGGSSCGAS